MPLFKKAKYSTVRRSSRREIPAGLWLKCKGCQTVVYTDKLSENHEVCPQCNYYYPLTAQQRIDLLCDANSFSEIDGAMTSVDVLNFAGSGVYGEKLAEYRQRTGLNDAVVCGTATLDKQAFALGVMDFRFAGASMGSVVGEKITRLCEKATQAKLPLVVVTASGGARMYEGMFSLMQMAKTSAALARHQQAELAYIVILTHPTTAGVSASFAMLGDVHLAEPGALIGFAGPRVIKQTTQSELPEGFQTSEFLLRHGIIDRVISRHKLRDELSLFLSYFSAAGNCQVAR